MQRAKIRIGITLGDPHGIGPEVIIKALQDRETLASVMPTLYGTRQAIDFYQRQSPHLKPLSYTPARQSVYSFSGVEWVECGPKLPSITPGVPSSLAGEAARAFLRRGVEDVRQGRLDALVTGPIDKRTIYSSDFPYRGHTDYLARQFSVFDPLMMMVSSALKVALLTDHIPVSRIAHTLTDSALKAKIDVLEQALRHDFNIPQPRIAVLGLNPHAGDGGLIGREEITVIEPLLKRLKRMGKEVYGPYSPDGFFAAAHYKEYDATLALYHDQGLIPFKLLAFESGVNYTAGLPVVRTAPDHGVAYRIAGRDQADENPMKQAIYTAAQIARHRSGGP